PRWTTELYTLSLHDALPISAERRLPTPVADQQPAEEHAAQVREVGHAGLQAGRSEEQLDRTVDDHQRARLHRDRRDQQHHPVVRDRKSTRLNSSHVKISYAV